MKYFQENQINKNEELVSIMKTIIFWLVVYIIAIAIFATILSWYLPAFIELLMIVTRISQ
jgi:hypothetical protein